MPEIPGNSSTSTALRVGETLDGSLETIGDHDWYRLSLTAGQQIEINLVGSGANPVVDTYLRIRDANGIILYENDDVGSTLYSAIAFTAPSSGLFFVDVSSYGDSYVGAYQISAREIPPSGSDIPGSVATTAILSVGDTLPGTLDTLGDRDWYRLSLDAGQEVRVDLAGFGANPVLDSYLRIRDANGTLLYENDDIGSSFSLDASIAFRAPTSGVYFVEVGSYADEQAGTYQVSVSPYVLPPEYSFTQIATQLVTGQWGGESSHFNLAPGGTLTVNLTELTSAGQELARAALIQWAQIIDVRFLEVMTGGQITFDDNEEGAFSTWTFSDVTIINSHVNVSADWIAEFGTGLHTYSLQTYLHEIGHALGLGHGGNYNTDASYPYDVLYRNDSWAASVMSYFDQAENTFIAGQGFTRNFVETPMIADVLAMSMLYSRNTTIRADDSLYTGGAWASHGAVCIVDAGGIDTIDGAGFEGDQTINLNPGTYSNMMGEVGNVSIAFGTIIENATGRGGSDRLIGNDAANRLDGGGGNDTLTGGAGNDVLIGGLGIDRIDGGAGDDLIYYDSADVASQVSGGTGNDVLRVENMAAPTTFNLAAQGFESAERFVADAGGTQSYYSILENYNASWAMLRQLTFLDDGSSIRIDFDPANLVNTRQVWSSFDSVGRLSTLDQLFDNGTRTFINVDETGTQSFTQDWFNYDAQGRLDSQDVRYDNGTHTFINFDQASTQTFSQDWFVYDAQGRLDSQDVYYDNGSRTFINFDQANVESWNQAWFTYDAQGRLDTQDVLNDDGSHTFYNYDQGGSEPFSLTAFLYNTNGTLYQRVVVWDDGSMTYTNV